MAIQPSLCRTLSGTPKTGFHATQLISQVGILKDKLHSKGVLKYFRISLIKFSKLREIFSCCVLILNAAVIFLSFVDAYNVDSDQTAPIYSQFHILQLLPELYFKQHGSVM